MNQIVKKALLIDVIPPQKPQSQAQMELNELSRLVETYGGIVIKKIVQSRGRPSAKTFLGTGKAEYAADEAKKLKVDVVIINGFLKPAQVHHLSKLFSHDPNDITGKSDIPVWDRTDIILNIFEKHASTQEAKLQIKLAQLKHQIPKVYHYQTNLFDKERGGIGGTRGAGEKGIEQEKRHIRAQIRETEQKLKKMQSVHKNQKQRRKRAGLKTLALVGYTNAGKSTLMNALTGKKVYQADELFATLDTRLGSLWIPDETKPYGGFKVVLADTIGFIQNLPPHLIESFKATLAEVRSADLIIHVIDSSDDHQQRKINVVEEVLEDIIEEPIPKLLVFNKNDQQNFCLLQQKNKLSVSAFDKKTLINLKEKIKHQFDLI